MVLFNYMLILTIYMDMIMLQKIFKKRINEIYKKFNDKKILISDEKANFFGLESLGVRKIRGNGVLLLTKKELFFGMWKPKRDLLILVRNIIEISNPKSHMHRSAFRPLLNIVSVNEQGEFDSAAWYVRELDNRNQILKELIKNR